MICTEKLRLHTAQLLIGKSRQARVLVLFVRFLKLLRITLFLSGYFNSRMLMITGVAVIYFAAQLLLTLLICCSVLLKDRYFMSVRNGKKINVSTLVIGFGLGDMLLAVKLGFIRSIYLFYRSAVVFAVPVLLTVFVSGLLRHGLSVPAAIAAGTGLLAVFAVATAFCTAAVSPVRCAAKLTCYEKNNLISNFRKKLKALDISCFALLKTRFFYGKFFSAQKDLALQIASIKLLNTEKAEANVNKL